MEKKKKKKKSRAPQKGQTQLNATIEGPLQSTNRHPAGAAEARAPGVLQRKEQPRSQANAYLAVVASHDEHTQEGKHGAGFDGELVAVNLVAVAVGKVSWRSVSVPPQWQRRRRYFVARCSEDDLPVGRRLIRIVRKESRS